MRRPPRSLRSLPPEGAQAALGGGPAHGMKPLLYLGDEVSAAGFRLAGVAVRVVAAGSEAEAFAAARAEAALLLVGADCAARLPAGTLQAALHAGRPLLLVLPALAGELPAGDPAADVRRLLGLLS